MEAFSLSKIKIVITFLILFYFIPAAAQNSKTPLISIKVEDVTLQSVLDRIKADYKVDIFYMKIWVENIRITCNYESISIEQFLKNELERYNFTFQIINPSSIVLLRNPNLDIPDNIDITNAIIIGDQRKPITGENVNIKGIVFDGKTDQSLPGARIYVKKLNKQIVCNQIGEFEATIPSSVYDIEVSYIGYEKGKFLVKIHSSGSIQFKIYESTTALQEVVVEASRQPILDNTQMSKSTIEISTLKRLPPSLGEVDIIKSISLIPGVTNVGEGSSGFNVRGGNVDQNLILLDDAPIFNSAHLLGFYSIFNEDVIQNVEFYRGSVPAQYGGRASSVLNITKKEGNNKKTNIHGGIGLISSRLSVDGPIIKDKTTYQIGVRGSHINWFLEKVRNNNINRSNASFYDISGKIAHQINENNKLTLSLYKSNDVFAFASDTSTNWNTEAATLKISSIINNKLSSYLGVVYSKYDYSINFDNQFWDFNQGYIVKNHIVNYDLQYSLDQHKIITGIQMNNYSMNMGYKDIFINNELDEQVNLPKETASEINIFVQDDIKINSTIRLSLGLRYNYFFGYGNRTEYIYEEGFAKSEQTLLDSVVYNQNSTYHGYGGLEPRFGISYNLNPVSTVKFNYSRMRQNLHLISNTASIQPIDIWKLSDFYLEPQVNDQLSLGYYYEGVNDIEFSTEIYYKNMNNILDYKDGASLILNPNLEREIVQGNGRSFGAEFLIKKETGNATGWFSYTYTNTRVSYISDIKEENINDGRSFAPFYDKPHSINLVASYKLSRRYSLSGNFVYSTGRPFTAPSGLFLVNNSNFLIYSDRNLFRMPEYHRLDIALKINPGLKKKQPWRGDWTLGIYNVYARKNAFSVYFTPSFRGADAYQLSLIGLPIPTITYNFHIL